MNEIDKEISAYVLIALFATVTIFLILGVGWLLVATSPLWGTRIVLSGLFIWMWFSFFNLISKEPKKYLGDNVLK